MDQIGNGKSSGAAYSPMDIEESTSAGEMNVSGEMLLKRNVMDDSSDSRPFQNLQQRNIKATSNDLKYNGDTAIAEARDFQTLKECNYLNIISTVIDSEHWQALEDILSKVIRIDMTDKESREINSEIIRTIKGSGTVDKAFMFAVKHNQLSLIKVLIRTGFCTNYGNDPTIPIFYPLSHAVSVKNSLVVDFLLNNGADATIGEKLNDHQNPLLIAISNSDAECTRLLLKHRAKPHAVNHSRPPMYYAVESGSVECAELLLSHGANIQETDAAMGYVRLAVNGNHTMMLEFLLKHNANPNHTNSHGYDSRTTLQQALYKRNVDMVRLLLAHKATILHGDCLTSVILKNIGCLNLLLNNGADINEVSRETSPLEYAVNHRLTHMARYLNFKGANFLSADGNKSENNALLEQKCCGVPLKLEGLCFWKINDILDRYTPDVRIEAIHALNLPDVLKQHFRLGFLNP